METILEFNKYVVAVKYLAIDYVFHRLTGNTIEQYGSLVSWVCPVSSFENSCNIGLLPVERYFTGVVTLLKYGAKIITASLRILAGMRSGLEALAGLMLLSIFSIPGAVNTISGIGVTGCPSTHGRRPLGSLVNCKVYCELKASATSFGSLISLSSDFRTGILLCPDFFCSM